MQIEPVMITEWGSIDDKFKNIIFRLHVIFTLFPLVAVNHLLKHQLSPPISHVKNF
jgi:hypothetical protein